MAETTTAKNNENHEKALKLVEDFKKKGNKVTVLGVVIGRPNMSAINPKSSGYTG